jgi:hypothetical protein
MTLTRRALAMHHSSLVVVGVGDVHRWVQSFCHPLATPAATISGGSSLQSRGGGGSAVGGREWGGEGGELAARVKQREGA